VRRPVSENLWRFLRRARDKLIRLNGAGDTPYEVAAAALLLLPQRISNSPPVWRTCLSGVCSHGHWRHNWPMTLVVILVSSLAVAWTVRKLVADRPKPQRLKPQRPEPRTSPVDHELPRALSYTEMMNSGQQRMARTPQGDDL